VISEAYDAAPNTIALLVPKGAPEPAPATALQACKSVSVAVTSKFSPEFLALSSWLNSRRTPIDINCIGVKEIANPIEAIAAVKAHTVAAAVLQEPYVTTAEVDDGLSVAEDMASGDASQMPLDGYFATRDFTVRFPKTTRIFGAVMAKLQAAAGQRAGLEGMLNSQTGADPLITSTMQIGTFPSVVLGAKLDIVIRLMDNAGTLSGTLTGLTLAQLSGSASMH
jgi:NitT/TauT family transport system substrate-binding protein